MSNPAFSLVRPKETTTSVVFASPHSGRDYDRAFLRKSVLDQRQIRSSEDAFVDLLLKDVLNTGAPLICARAPRAFIDLNRNVNELDAALIDGVTKTVHSPRVASGLGVIPRVVSSGRAIYHGKIPLEEAHRRIRDHWRPYHDMLGSLLYDNLRKFGQSILIDCHSMPHEAIDTLTHHGMTRPDVVLGDRFGASAAPEIVDRVEAAFQNAGFCVVRNAPFAGAFITQHYGRPSHGQHAVQVEIDRALYMDEVKVEPNANFAEIKAILARVCAEISDIGRHKQQQQPLAAE